MQLSCARHTPFMLWPQVLERTQVIVKEQFKVRSLLSGDS